MIVLNLICGRAHRFEGWFASNGDYARQVQRHQVSCPMCGSVEVNKLPSNPRIGRGAGTEPVASAEQPSPEDVARSAVLRVVRQLANNSEDVGDRFVEEARRIHYKETPSRNIRGQASRQEAGELLEEGIMVVPLPIPATDDMH